MCSSQLHESKSREIRWSFAIPISR
jgi:hypothetical protein